MDASDHDLLIRIDTNLVAFNKSFQEHLINDIKEFANIELKLMAAHRRLDGFVNIANRVLGGFMLVTIAGSIAGVFVAFKNLGWFR